MPSISARSEKSIKRITTLIHIGAIFLLIVIVVALNIASYPLELTRVTTYTPQDMASELEVAPIGTEFTQEETLVIEVEDFATFLDKTREKTGQYFLIVSDHQLVTRFDYLFFVSDVGVVYQYTETVDNPEYSWGLSFGYYSAVKLQYVDGEVVIQRMYNDLALPLVGAISIVALFLYRATNTNIRIDVLIERILIKIFKHS
jgi:hypothetical protein